MTLQASNYLVEVFIGILFKKNPLDSIVLKINLFSLKKKKNPQGMLPFSGESDSLNAVQKQLLV